MTNRGSGAIEAAEDTWGGPPRAAMWPRSAPLELQEQGHRPVVDERHLHVRAEDATGGAEALAEAFVERLGDLWRCGRDVRRAVALASVAVEGELADDERLAVPQRLVHASVGVGEDAQRADLVGEPVA